MITKQSTIRHSLPANMSTQISDQSHQLAGGIWNFPTQLLTKLFRTLVLYQRRFEGRLRLQRLDARMLDDIGMTPEQRRAEVAKPFWQR